MFIDFKVYKKSSNIFPLCSTFKSSYFDAPIFVIQLANCIFPEHHLILLTSLFSSDSQIAAMSNLKRLSSTNFVE